jgi:tetratricopeptide (TPR) repeat protein
MRRSGTWLCILSVLLPLGVAPQHVRSQAPTGSRYQEKRVEASRLFEQGKRLEALPLLEELVSASPRDDQMLVALAACLVEHAATLPDQEAGKERLRARDLLEQAQELGNRSNLALNLSELLARLPQSGALRFSDNAAVEQAMRAGEAAFSEGDFVLAIENYSRALKLDPKSYEAALFIGHSYDREGRVRQGAEWYERAMRLDPNIETAYRYFADMVARQGELHKARTLLIQAAVAEPYNRMVWRELNAWASLNGTQINQIFVAVPAPAAQAQGGSRQPTELEPAWRAYREVTSRWQGGGEEFRKRYPDEKQYRHSLREEADALTAAARVLKKLAQDSRAAGPVKNDPSASLLLRLDEAGLIEPYVLFSLGDRGISQDYGPYRARNRDKLQAYLDQFVVPPGKSPAPARARQ